MGALSQDYSSSRARLHYLVQQHDVEPTGPVLLDSAKVDLSVILESRIVMSVQAELFNPTVAHHCNVT